MDLKCAGIYTKGINIDRERHEYKEKVQSTVLLMAFAPFGESLWSAGVSNREDT